MNETKETNLIIEYINNERRTYDIKRQVNKLIEQAYNEGFKAGQEEVALSVNSDKYIEQGRNEAWEALKKIYLSESDGGLSSNEIGQIFSIEWYTDIVKNFSASEAIEKIHAYEERKKQEEDEIKVGDEVILNANSGFDINTKAVVIAHDKNEVSFNYKVMDVNGDAEWINRDAIIRKTGRTFPELIEILKKMQEDKE